MTLTLWQLALYSGAMLLLWVTPGPVFVALTARGLSGGFHATWPLALGVAIGDFLWPLTATLGLSLVIAQEAQIMGILRWVAAGVFVVMGIGLLRHADAVVGSDSRLARPGIWAGFSAGLAAVIGNPKAILFYMGMLPGFFDLSRINGMDVLVICLVSMLIPFGCNLIMGWGLSHLCLRIGTQAGFGRINRIAGAALIAVGAIITQT